MTLEDMLPGSCETCIALELMMMWRCLGSRQVASFVGCPACLTLLLHDGTEHVGCQGMSWAARHAVALDVTITCWKSEPTCASTCGQLNAGCRQTGPVHDHSLGQVSTWHKCGALLA